MTGEAAVKGGEFSTGSTVIPALDPPISHLLHPMRRVFTLLSPPSEANTLGYT